VKSNVLLLFSPACAGTCLPRNGAGTAHRQAADRRQTGGNDKGGREFNI